MLHVVLITGISGSGKSVALRQLEDLGYACIDNLPVSLLHDLVANARENRLKSVAVAIDVRTPGELAGLPGVITALRSMGLPMQVIFLDSDDETLIHRYSESRRKHPLSNRMRETTGITPSLEDCITHERNLLAPLREQEHVIDTSGLTPGQLRAWVKDIVDHEEPEVLLTFESFAYKKGVPNDADLVFDVRCLPNPHYDSNLRPLTGRDEPVAAWLAQFDSVPALINDIAAYIEKWLPLYMQDTRSYLTVAIGCTGGQHRSVYVAEELAKRFSSYKPLRVRHRAQLTL
ncbi:glmZ(sRNA)-inactivating NTPase [Advenella kashmirensis WT001]|uniref:GlmZ(SRNA)-inactivating NTPase n=1 Tax=Advenella kashmirensis (strain DSM 17095 / LMG 22695 / WT001) TaxID=1036672 RepID=I3U8F8_ADVKW|nr:RNase adapter RapZ [Advenella kashmirensis]AFK61296.1 glmZ(sRNA)-inactivating NTPase [Advenella kashmirensis WT001]